MERETRHSSSEGIALKGAAALVQLVRGLYGFFENKYKFLVTEARIGAIIGGMANVLAFAIASRIGVVDSDILRWRAPDLLNFVPGILAGTLLTKTLVEFKRRIDFNNSASYVLFSCAALGGSSLVYLFNNVGLGSREVVEAVFPNALELFRSAMAILYTTAVFAVGAAIGTHFYWSVEGSRRKYDE